MKIPKKVSLTLLLIIVCLQGYVVIAQNNSWTNFRGPDFNGHSSAVNIPTQWDSLNNVEWKTAIQGKGWSSPVILNGQIWLSTASPDGTEFRVICLDEKSGKIIHNIKVFEEDKPLDIHPQNSYASPSPVLEDGYAYVHFGTYGTACINAKKGRIVWKRNDINCDHEVGPGSSPVIHKDLLILTMDGTDVQYIQTLNKKNGKTLWKRNRGLDFSNLAFDRKKAFYTPIIHNIDGNDLILCAGPHAIMGYNPENGAEKWIVKYEGFSGSSMPIIENDNIIFNTGFGLSSIVSIKLGGKGDQTAKAINWLNKKSVQARSSPIMVDGLIYMVNTGGQAKCINPDTGEAIWTERVGRQTSASPIFVEGKIYSFDEEGLCTIFKPGRNFEKISENRLPDGTVASPAVIDGSLFVRTKSHLYKLSGK